MEPTNSITEITSTQNLQVVEIAGNHTDSEAVMEHLIDGGDMCFVEVAGTVEIGFNEDEVVLEEEVVPIPVINTEPYELHVDGTHVGGSSEMSMSTVDQHGYGEKKKKRHKKNENQGGEETDSADENKEDYTDVGDLVAMTSAEVDDSYTTDAGGMKCLHCKRWFDNGNELQSHSCNLLNKHSLYQCQVCKRAFVTNAQLKVHTRIHTGAKPYECSTCKRCFAQSSTLIQHIRTHTGERPYKCVYCEKAFTTMGNMNLHLRIHTGEKPYACTHCGKTFRLSGDLKKHITVHTGERAFKCDICGKSYKQHSQLTVHKRTHENGKPPKPMKKTIRTCVSCGKVCSSQKAMQKHLVDEHIRVVFAESVEDMKKYVLNPDISIDIAQE